MENVESSSPPDTRGHPVVRVAPWWLPTVGTIAFFPFGILSFAATVRSRSLAEGGERHAARVEAEKAKNWAMRAVTVCFSLLLLGFIALILLANNHALITDFLEPSQVGKTLPLEFTGFKLNIKLFMVGEVTVLAWSLVVALARSAPGPLAAPIRFVATVYVDLFRSLPSLLVILIVAYGIKRTGLPIVSSLSDFWSVIFALTLVYGAYVGEVIKGAMDAVHWSQKAAARSLGLSYMDTMRYVVLPPALRSITTPLLNAFISLQKDTSLVSIIGLLDAVNYAQVQALQNANLSAFTGVALCFLVVTVPLTRLADAMMKRDRRRTQAVS